MGKFGPFYIVNPQMSRAQKDKDAGSTDASKLLRVQELNSENLQTFSSLSDLDIDVWITVTSNSFQRHLKCLL